MSGIVYIGNKRENKRKSKRRNNHNQSKELKDINVKELSKGMIKVNTYV